jgi:hypothetical protein
VENEDLRDKLHLWSREKGYEIEEQQYLPGLQVDEIIARARSGAEL